jgi:hypothetical protein
MLNFKLDIFRNCGHVEVEDGGEHGREKPGANGEDDHVGGLPVQLVFWEN